MEGWQIVKFIEENDLVEAVPASWILEECGAFRCLWPDTISAAKVRAAIRQQENPRENWNSLPVEILSSSPYDNFYVATKKAGMAKYTSELDTESEFSKEEIVKRRTKKRNSRYFSSEDDTSPPEKVVRRSPRFKLPTPPSNNSQIASSSQSEKLSVVKRNLNLEKEVTTLIIPNSDSNTLTTGSATFTSAKHKCLSCKDSTEIIRLLHIINGRVTQNTELIMAIINSRNEPSNQDNDPKPSEDINIPAKSYIELMELDKKLTDKNIRNFMVNKLLHVGGIDVKDVIRRCTPQLVEDDVLRQFSWVGGKGKKKFSTLSMAALIKEVCKKNPLTKQFTEKQVEERLAIFLTKATERCNRRLNKENKQNVPEEELQ